MRSIQAGALLRMASAASAAAPRTPALFTRAASTALLRTSLHASTGVKALIPQLEKLSIAAPARSREASTTTATKKPAAKKSTTTKKPATKKAAAKKPAKKAAKAPKKPKLKPWEALGPDGKKLPLPFASKPTRRSSFIIFMQDRLSQLKDDARFQKPTKSDPSKQGTDIAAVARYIGEEWRSLDASSKERYTEKAAQELRDYERKMKAWQESLTPEDIKRQNKWISAQRKAGKKGTALIKDPKKPKKPLSAFFEFLSEYRSQATGTPATSIAKEAAERWRGLSAAQKQPYENKAAGAAEQYKRDLAAYNASVSA